ncbi:hypothetical protein PR202_gb08535 [Eleusine coracana subsp. coracana]|uniref:Uncharacterized protein n=1 Tax=Eleusine coracana subsp. coracana TaxID=191504 RepID=A0AAV5EEY2_ELECO|nr:hypothetical protein PR202_gb08535 [Eleusine coracana subsp. coracana]
MPGGGHRRPARQLPVLRVGAGQAPRQPRRRHVEPGQGGGQRRRQRRRRRDQRDGGDAGRHGGAATPRQDARRAEALREALLRHGARVRRRLRRDQRPQLHGGEADGRRRRVAGEPVRRRLRRGRAPTAGAGGEARRVRRADRGRVHGHHQPHPSMNKFFPPKIVPCSC